MNAIYKLFSVITFWLCAENACAYDSLCQLTEEESFIKEYEGFSPKAYKDSDGKYTIGYGHKVGNKDHNLTITKQKSTDILEKTSLLLLL